MTLVWTSAQPTEPGRYWCRLGGDPGSDDIVRVEVNANHPDGPTLQAEWPDGWGMYLGRPDPGLWPMGPPTGTLWAGPVPKPADPPAEGVTP